MLWFQRLSVYFTFFLSFPYFLLWHEFSTVLMFHTMPIRPVQRDSSSLLQPTRSSTWKTWDSWVIPPLGEDVFDSASQVIFNNNIIFSSCPWAVQVQHIFDYLRFSFWPVPQLNHNKKSDFCKRCKPYYIEMASFAINML